MKISICIPTLNRPQYLMDGIKSIYNQQCDSFDFEVCISNNASDADYSGVDDFIHACNLKYKNIKYYIHKKRLPLDEHMHFVKKMASGEYIYFLGDDDYFKADAINEIMHLCKKNIDLAVFNGDFVDKNGDFIDKHFDLPSGRFDSLESAFFNLRDKGAFGAILVKKSLLDDYSFQVLYGSSHAYGCFWLQMLNNPDRNYEIIIPKQPCVNLRVAEKSYNEAIVYYRDIVREFCIYDQEINNDKGREMNSVFFDIYKNRIFSIKWMSSIFSRGANFSDVVAEKNSAMFICKKVISFCIGKTLIYPFLRFFYRLIKH